MKLPAGLAGDPRLPAVPGTWASLHRLASPVWTASLPTPLRMTTPSFHRLARTTERFIGLI